MIICNKTNILFNLIFYNMKPLNSKMNQYNLYKMELDKIVNKKDPLIILSTVID